MPMNTNNDSTQARPLKSRKGIFSKIWGVLASVKLTLFVLLLLAIVSIIGTVIEQNKELQFYYMTYGQGWGDFIIKLGLTDMYHALWFTAILGLIVVNIVVCTIERFPSKWRNLLGDKTNFKVDIIDKLSRSDNFELAGVPSSNKDGLLRVLKKKKYKHLIREEGTGFALHAWRGVIGRFGSDFTHVSLLVILLGAIIGSFWGYKDFRVVLVGDTMQVPNAEFELRLDNFWMEYYDSGQIKQYNSDLIILEDGKEVGKKHIWVNEPLYYKGIRFYQSSWGKAWNRLSGAEVILKTADGKFSDPIEINWMETKPIPTTGYSIKLVAYVSDFAFDTETKTVFSKSGETNNPAANFEIYKDGKVVFATWLLFNHPELVQSMPDASEGVLLLNGIRGILYSGISINKDPGTNIVWLGCLIMGLGCYFSFFVFHRRLWVRIEEVEGKTLVTLGGMINKNDLLFDKEFNLLVKTLKEDGSKSFAEVK
ncbi:MAG: cytochrome c biogenesis protein ResB [Deltaproteobacteria bacterium]|nr:cytochrome c biogenesis protein ResB [Deltaproteobacteria bacterium]